MTVFKTRAIEMWDGKLEVENRADGSILLHQIGELAAYPDKLSDKIHHWAETTPHNTWMAERENGTGDWVRVDYQTLLASIRAIGQTLLDLGLSADRPLMILSGNSIAHALMALGAQYVGVPSAAIAPAYALSGGAYGKLKGVARQITPGAVFAEDTGPFSGAIDTVFGDIPVLGVCGDGLVKPWKEVLETVASSAVDHAADLVGPDTVAKFVFTSGTTGSPKAVIQTQRMLCANMEMVSDCFRFMRNEPPVFLDWAPWNHVASGNKVFNMTLYFGGTFYIDGGKPAPGAIDMTIRNLHEVSPTWYFNVPAGYDMLIEAMKADKALAKTLFKDLKLMMYAGAGMAAHTWSGLEDLAREATGEYIFMSTGLGATETAPFALFNTRPSDVPGNIGIPAKGLTLKLVPSEGKWEARLKGPSITPGYWRDQTLTAEAFDEEGFYRLGDALRFADPEDPEQGFFFDGRVAENFKLGTGTWVAVGDIRAKLANALGGLARDVVLAGEGQSSLVALLVPFPPAMARISGLPEDTPLDILCADPKVRRATESALSSYNKTATGSSMRVPRVSYLTEPLDLEKGEVTDKGSVNQRAVLQNRAALVQAIYEGTVDTIDLSKG